MEREKKNLVILFAGPGCESEISIISAKSIFANTNKKKYNIFLIGMSKENKFFLFENNEDFLKIKSTNDFNQIENKKEIFFIKNGFLFDENKKFQFIDCVFNIIHGEIGEDGILQGFLSVLEIPYVGCDHKSSAILMDKEFSCIIAEKFAKELEFNILKFITVFASEDLKDFEFYKEELSGLPFFAKASNCGSSRGVYKINNKEDFQECIKEIFKFDKKIIFQAGIEAPREIELAVISFENGKKIKIAEKIGEIKPSKKYGFYSYEAKYNDASGAELIILGEEFNKEIREKFYKISEKLFKVFCQTGMARIDYFLDGNNKIYFNEFNTLPGFTSISMFPTLFEKSGIKYSDLIDILIEEAKF